MHALHEKELKYPKVQLLNAQMQSYK